MTQLGIRTIVLLIVLAGVSAACGGSTGVADSSDGVDSTPSADDEQNDVRLALVVLDLSNEAIADIVTGAQERAEELGGIEILVTGTDDGAAQAAAVENYIALDVDLIGYDSVDAAAVGPAVVKANDADIPVIGIISEASSGEILTFISPDFTENGRIIGRWMAEAVGDGGKVAMVEGNPADAAAANLHDGYVEGLEEADPSVELVASLPSDWDRVKALSVSTDILTANSDLNGMYGANDDVAGGVYRAVQTAGREDDVLVAGHNGTCEALASVLAGDIDFTVMLFNKAVGALFVDTAMAALAGTMPEPEISVPVFGLDTATAQAILDGSQTEPEGLAIKERLETANSGCS